MQSTRRIVVAASLALLIGASLANADVATFTITADVSGTLGSTSFGFTVDPSGCACDLMTITLTGETSNIAGSGGLNGPDFTLPGLTGSINISSPYYGTIADAQITGTLEAFSDNNLMPGVALAGLVLGSNTAVFWEVELFPPIQAPYNLATSFSSGSDIFSPNSVSGVSTDQGFFEIDSITGGNSSLTWSETVTTPEPEFPKALLALALLVLAASKRGRMSGRRFEARSIRRSLRVRPF